MGEVWKGRDTRLDRSVAIKVSKEEFSGRFEREAKAIAALNHPHICQLYDVGPNYLVMEYLAGKPLKGPLPIDSVVQFTIQICEALEAAHAAGIVHRDLKPANIFVLKGGIKLLDFGLATLKAKDPSTEPRTETIALTQENTILGTLQYMSPEQLEGKEADARGDIFALGSVMYEMITGQPPFNASSTATLIADILRTKPVPASHLQPATPQALDRVIAVCLEKDPAERWQSAGDVARALQLLPFATEPQPAKTSRSRAAWIVAGVLAVSLIAAAAKWPRAIPMASLNPVPLTWYAGLEDHPALSPDGKLVAFSWTGPNFGAEQIFVKQTDSGQPIQVTHTPGASYSSAAWSPDGRQIATLRNGPGSDSWLVLISALGGPERQIARLQHSQVMCWLAARNEVLVAESSTAENEAHLSAVSVEDGKVRQITRPPVNFYDMTAAISLDGRTLAFARSGDVTTSLEYVYLLGLDKNQNPTGPERALGRQLQSIRGLAWAPGENSLFVTSLINGAMRISRLSVTDGVLTDAGIGISGAGALSVSAAARRMAFVWEQHDSDILRAPGPGWSSKDGPPPEVEPLIASTYNDVSPSYSPDGKRIAYDSEASGHQEIWVADSDGKNEQQLTNSNGAPVGSPRWSPDGASIAYDGRQYGNGDVFVISANGGASRRLTTEASSDHQPVWSSDGRYIFFESDRSGDFAIWKAPSGGGPAVQVTPNGTAYVRTLCGTGWVYYQSASSSSSDPPGSLSPGGGFTVSRIRETGGEIQKVASDVPFRSWAPYHGGIVRYTYRAIEISPDFSGKWSLLRKLPRGLSPRFFRSPTISLTCDDKWIAFHVSTIDRSDLMLVENLK